MARGIRKTVNSRTIALAFVCALVCAMCGIGAWAHVPAFADDDSSSLNAWNYKNVYLEPGQRYDIGDSLTMNTRVHITKPGEYTLHGSSTIATVRITTGGVTVYLEDGLKINPYGFANGQTAVSAITVEANSGDVRLVSKANATVKLDGYLEAPGVNKVGQGSRLIFQTEYPARPGHIICDRSGAKLKVVHTPGIGTVDPMNANVSNIVFKSGKVTAKGYGNAAGVGSALYDGGHEAVTGISIEGTAEVVAVGGNGGAPGIGSVKGDTSITIKDDAKVTATGTEGAPGIGSGSANDTCAGRRVSVTIEGGAVTAKGGKNAPGIGSTAGNVDDIVISGGAVTAKGGEDAPGIGSTLGTVDAVKITGGAVTATRNGDSPGIGTGSLNSRTTRIEISGGIVSTPSARSGEPAIGTTSKASTADVRISGGTVDVKPGVIGVPKRDDDSDYGASKVAINGGTVRTESLAIYPAPVNSNGDRVRAATVSLENTDSGAVTSLTVKELSGYSYGTKDLELRGGHLYIWLPQGGAVTEASHENSNCFSGTVIVGESATQGTLYLGNNVILESGDAGMTDGSARASGKATHLTNVSAPTTAEDGYVAESYRSPDRLIPVVDAATNQVLIGDNRYVDAATGTWIYEGTYPVTLFTRWKPVTYGIVYDANIPDEASTAGQAQGTMLPKDNLTFGDDYMLMPNRFSLPGYEFVGWSLVPDGGVMFDDQETITGEGIVIGSDGGPYTLYAQWEPRTYDVTFTSGDKVSGDAYTQTLTFDEEDDLDAVQFESNAYRFAGWTSSDGTVYADGATALNLCTVNGDGTLAGCTLTAQWTTDDHVTVVITCDDEPVEILDPEENIALVPKGGTGGTEIIGFAKIAEGIYVRDNVPSGAYGIDFEPSAGEYGTPDITIEHDQGSNTPVTLAYYTATVNNVEDGHVRAFLNDPTPTGTSEIVVRKGTKATLWAGADAGYAFNGYTCVGVTPARLDPANGEEQTVTINGTVEITPHARSARYAIAFDANEPSGASSAVHGEMASASVAYGEGFALPENAFRLNGYTFAGWNTAKDGMGTAYADAATVENLANIDGATVKLYAQWQANSYAVSFDGNKPAQASTDISGSMTNMDLSFDDRAQGLTANGYSLPGYEFAGWNTAADGTGSTFANQESVRNLASENGAVVTLYAQWEPLTYTISFSAGEEGSAGNIAGTMPDLVATFDETVQLPTCGFAYEGHVFSHWSGLGFGSSYSDSASVKNLCGTPLAEGGLSSVTLSANWMEEGETAVVVRLDGEPVADLDEADVKLKLLDKETSFTGTAQGDGRFVFAGLPESDDPEDNVYVATIEGYDTGRLVIGRGETVIFDFYSVTITPGEGVESAWVGSEGVSSAPRVLAGAIVRIGATADEGYAFDRYTATGVDPTWDPTIAEQSVVVTGKLEIIAHARAAEYAVRFDANVPAQASTAAQLSGSMADQEMTHGRSEALRGNVFALPGYTFAGWNTEADGSGTRYGDGDAVENLANADGATVTLYAQWDPIEYEITYDPGDAAGVGGGQLKTSTATFDEPTKLASIADLGFTPPQGKTFAGWSTGALGRYYADGEEVVNLCTLDEDGTPQGMTLTAQWSLIPPSAPSTNAVDREVAGHGTVTVDPERAAAGDTVTVKPQPDDGYGLYAIEVVDSAGNTVALTDNEDGTHAFEMPASAVTVKATFKVILPFADLDWDHWGYDDIALAYERGLMRGYDGTDLFGADDVTTRGMAMTVIWRLAGSPQATSDMPFTDVGDGIWYTEATRWAAEMEIATGYEGTDRFGPEDNVTREQIAALLMRYAQTQGMDTSARGDLSAFPDGDSTSAWARDAVEWAVAVGLLRGDSVTGLLDPQGGGSRAALAALVMRYDTMLPVGM